MGLKQKIRMETRGLYFSRKIIWCLRKVIQPSGLGQVLWLGQDWFPGNLCFRGSLMSYNVCPFS